jgi:hypothetical protein
MTDRTLPWWLRAVLIISALMQIGFAFTLLINPAAIDGLWPWPLTSITARLLGASTLVSVPLALMTIYFNRWSAARIPLVMMVTYRVLQLTAGVIHVDRFDLFSMTTINYFGGGGTMMLVMLTALIFGNRLGQPADWGHPWLKADSRLHLPDPARWVFIALGVVYFLIGFLFLIIGERGSLLWFEPAELLTGLTARLFASPAMGLALAMWLITRAHMWRQVAVPAVGMVTFGIAGLFAMVMEMPSIQPASPLGYLIPITPLILLLMGAYLLMPARSRDRTREPAPTAYVQISTGP